MQERAAHHDTTHRAGPAWHGELAVGETGNMQRLHALSGVDASAWRICGLDIRLSYGQPTQVGVFAVERERLAEAENDWSRLAEIHEAVVPVTEFAVPAYRGAKILELFPDLSLVAARASAVEGDGVELKVVSLLNVLSETDRAIVTMFYWYEYSYNEIAEALRLTPSAVKSRIHRARAQMAKSWMNINQTNAGLERQSYGSQTL